MKVYERGKTGNQMERKIKKKNGKFMKDGK